MVNWTVRFPRLKRLKFQWTVRSQDARGLKTESSLGATGILGLHSRLPRGACHPLSHSSLPLLIQSHSGTFGIRTGTRGWQCDIVGFEGTLGADSQVWHRSVVTFRATCPTSGEPCSVQTMVTALGVGREDSGSRPACPARPGSR